MPVNINEIIVSVEVNKGTIPGSPPPNNTELNVKIRKAVEELKQLIKTKNER